MKDDLEGVGEVKIPVVDSSGSVSLVPYHSVDTSLHPVQLYPWRVIGWTPELGLGNFIGGAVACLRAVHDGVQEVLDALQMAR